MPGSVREDTIDATLAELHQVLLKYRVTLPPPRIDAAVE
jgi:hypothetical protein